MFGYSSLNDLPELPKYKLDSNRQIVIDELVEEDVEENVGENVEEKNIEKTKESIDKN